MLTTGFLLSKVGKLVTDRYAEKVEQLGLRPKHCGLLGVVAGSAAMSQQELGEALGLVPSAIVTILDDLHAVHAIRRVEDPNDRRRYLVELTSHGQALATRSAKLAQELDAELLGELTASERSAMKDALHKVALQWGLLAGAKQAKGGSRGGTRAGKTPA